MKKKWLIWLMILTALAVLALVALDSRLITRHYGVQSEKITAPVRLVLLSDLHECDYGPDGERLMKALEAENPDAVLIAGDWFADGGDFSYGAAVLREISSRWPAYYVLGNHEPWTGWENRILQIVADSGVIVLHMTSDTLTVNGQTLRLCGVPDPYSGFAAVTYDLDEMLSAASAGVQPGEFAILLAHHPELIETYAQYPFDLVVSGHAHGGQVRIPGIVNGLYAPNQGWFPKYAGGEYQVDDTAMIVSRGLSTQAQWFVPRVFNRPEFVIIELE